MKPVSMNADVWSLIVHGCIGFGLYNAAANTLAARHIKPEFIDDFIAAKHIK